MSQDDTDTKLRQEIEKLKTRIDELEKEKASYEKNESPFKAVFNQSYQFALILDHTGTVLEMNPLCKLVCGKFADRVVGAPFWEAGWWRQFPEVQEKTKLAIKKTLQGEIVNDQVNFIDRDEVIHQGIRTFSPIRDRSNQISMISVVGLDVTEQIKTEEALRKNEKYLNSLLQNVQAAVVVHGPDTRIQQCNHLAVELLGLTEDQLLGKQAMDSEWKFFNDDGSLMPLDKFPVNRVIATRSVLRNLVAGIYRPDKDDIIKVLVNAVPEIDHHGNIAQVIVTFMDITYQKHIEEELRKSEQLFRSVYQTAPIAFVVWDLEARVTDWNQKAEEVFGWSKEEVMGKNFFDFLIPQNDKIQVEDVWEGHAKGSLISHSINDNLTKAGKTITCEWNNSGLFDDKGNLVGVISLGLDITDRILIEKEREKLIAELKDALSNIKTLKGLLPICSHCKKIRDDKGYWNQLEAYIQKYSHAEFSHSVCQECAKKYYPDLDIYD